MDEIRNAVGKLVCRVDAQKHIVEIVYRRYRTVVVFNHGESFKVVNSAIKKSKQ